jgi:glycosyltransferase involved in cell wall biosynthesis
MKITIITPSFNQGDYIEETILSVMAQNFESVEHIVIDGGSTDQTLDVLKRYPHIKWISEQDKGQADALNKGLQMATGDIIGWINSDDYYEKNIFESVIHYFEDPATLWVVGNLSELDPVHRKTIPRKSQKVTFYNLMRNPDIVRQQPSFFRRDLIERVGSWDSDFFMVMDFDLWVRMAKVTPPKMVDQQWAYFRKHELQKTSNANVMRQAREITRILKRESAPLKIIAIINIMKRWFLIKGLIKEKLIDIGILNLRQKDMFERNRSE